MKLANLRNAWRTLLVLATLASGSAQAATIVITIDDVAGNELGFAGNYTPGVPLAYNYTGVGALKSVVNDLRNTPAVNTSSDTFEVRIIDTDGVADTYTGSLNVGSKNTTIVQFPNGSGTDQPATIAGDGSLGYAQQRGAVRVFAENFALRGLSPTQRLIVDAGPHDCALWLSVDGRSGTATNPVFENLQTIDSNLTPATGGVTNGGPGNDYKEESVGAATATPAVVFRGVQFTRVNGPLLALPNTLFEDCDLTGGGFNTFHLNGATNITYLDSIFRPCIAGMYLGGDASANSVMFDGCTFEMALGVKLINALGPGDFFPSNTSIVFRDPTFVNMSADIPFALWDNNIDLTIEGSDPANPVDLDPLLSSSSFVLARLHSGSITLRNVRATKPANSGFFMDSLPAALEVPAPFNTDVDVIYENCQFTGGSGGYRALDNSPSAFSLHVTATNTIWTGSNVWGAIIDVGGQHVGNDTITLEHCTLAQSTTNMLVASWPIAGGSTLTFNTNNSLFDVTGTGTGAITFQALPQFGNTGNVRRGNGFAFPEPTGSFTSANFALAADGTLIPASVAAIGRATVSAETIDFEGDARPAPMASDRDAGADESPLGPADFGWPIEALRVETAAPVLDGVVNVAAEYTSYGSNAPVAVSLSGISAVNALNPALLNDGTNLSAPYATGSIANDPDVNATAYFMWDDDALYIGVVGEDDQNFPSLNPAVNGGDAFQLALDYDDTNLVDATAPGSTVFIPSWTVATNGDDPLFFQQFWPTSSPNLMPGTTWTLVSSGTSYTLEARIPWTAITDNGTLPFTKPFPPVDGQTAGLAVVIADHDDENSDPAFTEFSLLVSAGAGENVIGNASRYNTLTFIDPSPSVANGDANGDGTVDVADVTAIYNFVEGISPAPSGDADVALPTPTVDAADAAAIRDFIVDDTPLPLP